MVSLFSTQGHSNKDTKEGGMSATGREFYKDTLHVLGNVLQLDLPGVERDLQAGMQSNLPQLRNTFVPRSGL